MLKVRYNKRKHTVILDFCGQVGKRDFERAVPEAETALGNIGKGYTLIEIFRRKPFLSPEISQRMGALLALCYRKSRIWRVVRVLGDSSRDPGISILHRTRWNRQVPEMETDNIRHAMGIAEEELRENRAWAG